MQDDVTVTRVRRIMRTGQSALLVCLPAGFIHRTGLAKGDEVVVSYTSQVLTIVPNPDRMMEKEIRKGVNENDAGYYGEEELKASLLHEYIAGELSQERDSMPEDQ